MSYSLKMKNLQGRINRVFVETGTCDGKGVELAYQAGFQEIHSIELSEPLYQMAVDRVGKLSGVHLYLGDSAKVLPGILEKINTPCTFFLDAHYAEFPGTLTAKEGEGWKITPLRKELEILKRFPLSAKSIIMIDDIDGIAGPEMDQIGLSAVLKLLDEIYSNNRYGITFEDSARKESLLIAEP